MKLRTTIVLLLLTGAALAYILLEERHRPGTTELARTAHLLAVADPAEAVDIKIADAGGETRVRLSEGAWSIVKPFDDRADQEAVAQLLGVLTGLEILERIPSSAAIAGDEPFGPSAKEITLKRDEDHKILKILIGKPAPFENSVYARNLMADDPDETFVVTSPALSLLNRPVSDLRDPRILPFAAEALTRLNIRNGTGEIELARTGNGEADQWWLTKPLRARAHNPTVSDTISALTAARVRPHLESGNGGKAALSFEDDASILVTAWAGDEREPIKVRLLRSANGGDTPLVMARIDGRPPIFEVLDDILPRLEVMPNSLRDDTLAALDLKAINSILIQSRENPDIPLFRRGERWWTHRNGAEEEANQGRVETMVKAINDHSILEFSSDAASDLVPYGLDDPFLRVTFSTAELQVDDDKGVLPITQENSTTLLLGQGENKRIYAKFAAEPFVYTVGPSIISDVPTEPIKWKGLRITSFSMFDLRRITVTQGASPPLVLDYALEQNRWTATGPGGDFTGRLNLPLVEAYAAVLSAFYVDDWLSDRTRALAQLENPSLRIAIDLERDDFANGGKVQESVTLTFCPTNADGPSLYFYGRREDGPDVFIINRETYAALTAPLLNEASPSTGASPAASTNAPTAAPTTGGGNGS